MLEIVADPALDSVGHHLEGALLTMYTDGVTEARSDLDMLGGERLVQLIRAHQGDDADWLTTAVVDAVQSNRVG